jgi:hypothetical protein
MDDIAFDRLTQYLGSTHSRRTALGLAASALAGSLLAALGPSAAGGKSKRGEKPNHHPHGGGKCGRPCPDVMTRNRRTCACECPEEMIRCGDVCIGADHCCPGEKRCGGGCIREEDCCPHTHKECADGACLPRDGGACCPEERQCADGSCVGQDACCPVLESPCPADPSGCCVAGEECASNGCCTVLAGVGDVCDGVCVHLGSDEHCGACGNACRPCETCRLVHGNFTCVGPDQTPPACETCLEGEVVTAVPCGDHCCALGAECCGNGCCAAGKCRVQNGQPCCLRVEDNRLVCKVL